MSLCVGLTGGVASGKSTVAEAFAALGVPYIDADQVARDVVRPNSPGLQAVAAHFGPEVLTADGELDRPRMRELVFNDPAQRQQLEKILHPLIRAELTIWRNQLAAPYGLLMVPILVEGGFDSICDRILVVDVAEAAQIERLCARDNNTPELAKKILAAQASRDTRLARADDVIDNSGAAAELEPKVAALHAQYLKLAQSGS